MTWPKRSAEQIKQRSYASADPNGLIHLALKTVLHSIRWEYPSYSYVITTFLFEKEKEVRI